MSEELKPFADTAATEMQRMFALSSDLEKQNKTLKAENERLKSDLAIQKNLTKQMCFECDRRDSKINLLGNTIAGFRIAVRFMTEHVNFGSRATKSELHKRLSMVFGYLVIMENALARMEQKEINGEDAPDMDDGRKTEINGENVK